MAVYTAAPFIGPEVASDFLKPTILADWDNAPSAL